MEFGEIKQNLMRLITIIVSVWMAFCSGNLAFAAQAERIAVFPVDRHTFGSSFSIYPETLNLVANDIINSLSTRSGYTVVDMKSARNLLKVKGLNKTYNKFLEEYKSTYTIDYDSCAIIAKVLGVDKILLVSGGYETQQLMLKRNILHSLNIPDTTPIVPSYELHIVVTLVDPQSSQIIWEENYKKDFEMTNFGVPSQYFGDNVVPLEKIKIFSRQVSAKATISIAEVLTISKVTEIQSNVTSTDNILNQNPMEGITTKDGHFSSTNNVLINKKRNYREWIKEHLP